MPDSKGCSDWSDRIVAPKPRPEYLNRAEPEGGHAGFLLCTAQKIGNLYSLGNLNRDVVHYD
jgi:hypothetical protein